MHTCQQCLEHRVDKKTFSSGKKIFIMHEKVYIKDSGDRPPAIVTEPILIEKMFYNPYFGKHQQTYSGEKLHEHFNRDKSFIYKTNLKVNQISHIAKSYYTCSYCKKSFSCKSCLTITQTTETGDNLYMCNECKSELIREQILHIGEKSYESNKHGKANDRNSVLHTHK